ncbi:unnamed protein product [Bemisia tabaci]|uniref:UDP-glucuronosyltransferase n=1 Tax=Bemisia tabaci TaxID=7038 RepID=A0A9P0ALJ1_BEMTA|nr:unnamed protein product [Bemisia tabaci]
MEKNWKFVIRLHLLLQSSMFLTTDAFKILVFYPTPSLSHQRPIMALTERLVQKGHELFVVSPNAVPGLEHYANYTYVDISFSYKYFSDKKENETVVLQQEISKWAYVQTHEKVANIHRAQFLSEAFFQFQRRVISEKIKFDVVIAESYSIPYTCAITRMVSNGTPLISMTTFSADFGVQKRISNVPHFSFVPTLMSDYTDRMSLWQKIENWLSYKYLSWRMEGQMLKAARQFIRDAYGNESERLVDGCWESVSLSLVTSNSLYYYPRLLGPNIIETGPLHLKTPAKLPKNLQEWLNGAEKGVIYFSLGSNMKAKSLPVQVRANFLRMFDELPAGYRVLWKSEDIDEAVRKPHNILMQDWVPQDSVLAHPNVKLFITQGGLQSFQEAVHFGVPMVGIPLFVDQGCQVSKIVDAKIGVRLSPKDLHSFEKIKTAVESVLYDESYQRNIRKLSAISRDFSSVALDKATFWVEHVARHGGAAHLRPSMVDANLIQYLCLDIISIFMAVLLVISFILFKGCESVIEMVSNFSIAKVKKG